MPSSQISYFKLAFDNRGYTKGDIVSLHLEKDSCSNGACCVDCSIGRHQGYRVSFGNVYEEAKRT